MLLDKLQVRIKYLLFRTYIKLPKINPTLDEKSLNDEQRSGIRIVKMLAAQPESEILMAPLSEKYYIKNLEIFIMVESNRITIINSVYHYDIYTNENMTNYLSFFLRRVIEIRRAKMEKLMLAKIEKSLGHILEDLDTKFNKKGEE